MKLRKSPVTPVTRQNISSSHPTDWQIFIGHSPQKYRTSDENIGFIGHVSVYQ